MDALLDSVPPPGGPPPAAFGQRGELPVYLPTGTAGARWVAEIEQIPGVERAPGGLVCAWDIAWAVSKLLTGVEMPLPNWESRLPGMARYRALGLHTKTWPYQKEDIYFLTQRAWAVLGEPVRSGKSLIALGADVMVDSRKTLIVCPAQARLPWADEIQTWTGEAALVLYGRGGREARLRCVYCSGRGRLPGPDALTLLQCPHCKQRNGQSYGYKIYDVQDLVPRGVEGRLTCPKHPEVQVAAEPGVRLICGLCQLELDQALARARYVLCNYDLLVRQHYDAGAGVLGVRSDLEGWTPILKQIPFDVCIADESHYLRGVTTASKRRGEARNEKLFEVVGTSRVPRVWMMTGTPFFGFVRDIFWPVEIASGGLWGRQTRMRGRRFFERYCEGRAGEYGYESKGRSIYAETELVRRLGVVMVQRPREELFKDAPPVPHQVVRLELDKLPAKARPRTSGEVRRATGQVGVAAAIKAVSEAKRELVMDRLMAELAEGNKLVVFCYHVESAKRTFLALEKAIHSREYRSRMTQVNAQAWLATGSGRNATAPTADAERDGDDDPPTAGEQSEPVGEIDGARWARSADARYALAAAYRAHVGAGVIVSTIDAMPGSISLRGASSVHFIDLHWSPGAITQAGMRPWLPDVTDLTIIYYLAPGTVDDHIETEVLSKVETLARVAKERGAASMLAAFTQADEVRTAEAVWARLCAHLRDGSEGTVARPRRKRALSATLPVDPVADARDEGT